MMDLQGKFLIATLDMDDDYFDRAVIYLCEHTEQGSWGIMINSPTDLSVMELLAKMDFLMANSRNYSKDQLVLSGGPVSQERGFILHTASQFPFLHSYPTANGLMITTSGDILETFGQIDAPENFIVCLGCCTWKPEQLEQEIARNYWAVAQADETILFNVGYLDRWVAANALLGESIPSTAGRA